jgi:hypothetical protein
MHEGRAGPLTGPKLVGRVRALGVYIHMTNTGITNTNTAGRHPVRPMSRRLKITLPDGLAAQLDEMAANTGDPVARLAGQMVSPGHHRSSSRRTGSPAALQAGSSRARLI